MGLYFRKSARFGPFRVNFSTSGVGVSVGIPGFRVGTGPRGNYVQAGAHGFYYRATLPGVPGPGTSTRHQVPPSSAPAISPPSPDRTLGSFQEITTGDVGRMVDSSSEALLAEIRQKYRRLRWWRASASLGVFLLLLTWTAEAPVWAMCAVAASTCAATLLTFRWDLQRKLTVLHYELNPAVSEAFAALNDACIKLQSCRGLWHLRGQSEVLDRKYHAGAAAVVSRAPASIARRLPPYIVSNIDPIVIVMSQITLYGFPDRILVYRDDDVGIVAYNALECSSRDSAFIEEQSPPSDATVIRHTWRYVNKDGGPDRRFSNNPQLPVCRYEELTLRSGSGINEILQLSRPSIATDFVASVKRLAGIAVGASTARDRLDSRAAGAQANSHQAPIAPMESPAGFPGAAILATIFVLFGCATCISLYFQRSARELVSSPPAVADVGPASPVTLSPKPRHRHERSSPIVASQANPPVESSEPDKESGSPLQVTALDPAPTSSATGSSALLDALTTVRATDEAAAERIAAYCTKLAATAADSLASEMACRRSEVSAWTRLVVQQEFPNLDEATLAICSQPPFPDSYEGREACARYKLHVD